MRSFKNCDIRKNNKCIQSGKFCESQAEIKVDVCWRMCEENQKYLQCPKCFSNLWFDNHVTNPLGFKEIFFCPKCNKNINRKKAIQTFKRLESELKKIQKTTSAHKKLSICDLLELPPRQYDKFHYAKIRIIEIKKMISFLKKKQS